MSNSTVKIVVATHKKYTNISSIRKRKNSFIFRSGWCYNRLVVECRVNS